MTESAPVRLKLFGMLQHFGGRSGGGGAAGGAQVGGFWECLSVPLRLVAARTGSWLLVLRSCATLAHSCSALTSV